LQRAIGLRIDGKNPVAHREHGSLSTCRLAGCREAHVMMGTVAERLVLRGATPTQGRSIAQIGAIELQLAPECVGTGFPDAGQIYRRRHLVGSAIGAPIANRARRAFLCNGCQALCINGVRVKPRTLDVGEKHCWSSGNTEARMTAPFGFKRQRQVLPFNRLYPARGCRRCGLLGRR
jgi:hypothetical protein